MQRAGALVGGSHTAGGGGRSGSWCVASQLFLLTLEENRRENTPAVRGSIVICAEQEQSEQPRVSLPRSAIAIASCCRYAAPLLLFRRPGSERRLLNFVRATTARESTRAKRCKCVLRQSGGLVLVLMCAHVASPSQLTFLMRIEQIRLAAIHQDRLTEHRTEPHNFAVEATNFPSLPSPPVLCVLVLSPPGDMRLAAVCRSTGSGFK